MDPYNESAWQQGNSADITLSIDRKPFWTALREVCAAAELTPSVNSNNDRRILLAPAGMMGGQNLAACPTIVGGAFMVIATGLQRNDSVTLGSDAKPQRNLSVQLMVFAEPKAKVVKVGNMAKVEEAVDDKGRSLVPEGPDGMQGMQNMQTIRGYSWQSHARLTPLRDPGEKVAKVRGKISCLLETRADVFEVPNITAAKPTTQTVGKRRISFQGLKKTGDRQYEVHLSRRQRGPAVLRAAQQSQHRASRHQQPAHAVLRQCRRINQPGAVRRPISVLQGWPRRPRRRQGG